MSINAGDTGGEGAGDRLRVLCLHSFRTSAAILRDQLDMAQWPQSLGDLCDFTCMDAPHSASGAVPQDVASFFEPPYMEWWNATEVNGRLEYVGLEQSLASIDAFVDEHGPFDGVLGFSQGATLTGLMVASGVAEGRGPFAARGGADECEGVGVGVGAGAATSPTFALMISGMLARTACARDLYSAAAEAVAAGEGARGMGAGAATPSLHIIGDADAVMPPVLSARAAASPFFVDPVTTRHARGHVVPRLTGSTLDDVRAFMERLRQRRQGAEEAEEPCAAQQAPTAAL